jgi:putative ABC transport system substrate-binding protein
MVIGALREPDHAIAPTAMKALEDAAAHVGLRVHMVSVRSEDDFDGALSSINQAGISAFVASTSSLTWNNRVRVGELSLKYGLAGVGSAREMAEAGILMSYGANYDDLYPRAAEYVDKILRGVKPAETCLSSRLQSTSL